MGSYLGKHAEYYDLFYKDKPYAQEAAFVHRQIQKFASRDTKRILEIACGSGRHAFEFEKFGYEILATDYSKDLLNVARHRAQALGSKVEFNLQDMRELSFKDEFDAAVCLFDSIGYAQSNTSVLKVFRGIHDSLKLGGLFVVEFWHAAAMLRSYEPQRERTWQTEGGEVFRISTTKLDVEKQLAEVTYDIYDRDKKGEGETYLREIQINRYFLVQEMSALLDQSGLEPINFCYAYDEDIPIDESTWHILGVARRK